MNVRAALMEGSCALEGSRPGSPFLDATLLLSLALKLEKDRLLASMPEEVPPLVLAEFRRLIRRRSLGEPVAYILGYKEFYGRRFIVDPRVLVPRPDTELLVELALSLLPAPWGKGSGDNSRQNLRCHDAYTGSGCVGVSIAAERPDVCVSLSDASPEALLVAGLNARNLLGRDLDLRPGQVLSAAKAPLDLIVANPPYVSKSLTDSIVAEGGTEPRLALDGGDEGLDHYPLIVEQAFGLLSDGGALAVEIGEEQAGQIMALVKAAGFEGIPSHADLAGCDRVVSGVKHAL